MQHAEEIMEILEAFDLTKMYRAVGPHAASGAISVSGAKKRRIGEPVVVEGVHRASCAMNAAGIVVSICPAYPATTEVASEWVGDPGTGEATRVVPVMAVGLTRGVSSTGAPP